MRSRPCDKTDRIATLADWRAARDDALSPGSLRSESADEELGRTDISVCAPGMFAIIENKMEIIEDPIREDGWDNWWLSGAFFMFRRDAGKTEYQSGSALVSATIVASRPKVAGGLGSGHTSISLEAEPVSRPQAENHRASTHAEARGRS
jgi:hypothetical protein